MILLSWLGLAGAGLALAQNLDAPLQIHIPAQSLGAALVEFGRQTGIQVLMASKDLEGMQSPAVNGTYDARAALGQLLNGSNLQFEQVGANSIVIRRAAVPGERNAVAPGKSTTTSASAHVPSAAIDTTDGTDKSNLRPMTAGATRSRANASSSESNNSSEPLNEILVTAQRIGVDVMHAPLSLTAINGDDLQRYEVHDTADLQFYVPGLSVTSTALNTYVNIRGIGTDFTSPNIAQGVPVYRDGLPVPPNIGDEPLWDIASVQILRGPQGTLVGANSTGGAMFINTVNPTMGDTHGYLQVQGGDYRHWGAQGAANLPIADMLSARVGMYLESRDSYSENLTPLAGGAPAAVTAASNRSDPGNLNMLALRATLLWRPHGSIEVVGKINYFRNNSDYIAEKPIAIASTSVNGAVTACPAPGSYFNRSPASWSTVPSACGYAPFAPADPYQIAYSTPNSVLNERIWRESLESKFQLGDSGLSLRLLAGAAFNTIQLNDDNTASTDLTGDTSNFIHERTVTYEADLISSTSQKFRWVVGAYYWFDPATIRALVDNYSGGPVGVGPGYAVTVGGLKIHANSTKLSYAIFADATDEFAPRWQLETGLRETWDHNSNPFIPCASCPGGDANAFYPGVPNPANAHGPSVFPGNGIANLGYESDAFLTWKAALDYSLTPNDLYYGLIATGGKSGGIQGQQLGQNFAPERDSDLEIGLKASRLGGSLTLQLDGFYTRYTQMQIADTDTATGLNSIYNAGATNVAGLEVAAQAHLDPWLLAATGSYTRSSFNIGNILNKDICGLSNLCNNSTGQCQPGIASGTGNCFDYTSGGLIVDGKFYPWLEHVSGLQLPNSPTLQFNVALSHDFRLGNGAVLTPRLGFSYQGSQYSQIFDTPFDLLPVRRNLNFNLGYLYGRWQLEAYVTNLTNALYPVAINDTAAYIFTAPRQYGARFRLGF